MTESNAPLQDDDAPARADASRAWPDGEARGRASGEGVSGSGASSNGVSGNGIGGHGVAGNGVAGNGVAGNGAARNGVAGNGAASNGAASNGVTGNGVAGNGVAGNGVAGNGVAGSGSVAPDGDGPGASSQGALPPAGGFLLPARDARTYPFRRRYRRPILTLFAALVGAGGLMLWGSTTAALLFLGCAVVAFVLVPGVARLALRYGAVSLPGGRAVHDDPIPLVGGAALFIPVATTMLVLGLLGDAKAWGLLWGGTIVFACGLVDDVKGASARTKIVMQLLAGCALILAGFEVRGFGIPGHGVLQVTSQALGIGILLFWIVLATNALNLSDGLDGLATSLAVIGMGVLAAGGVGSFLPVALAGACLGFLYYNLPTARIFLGDAGSMLLGFLLAALALELPLEANVPLGIAALAYPLGDVTISVSRRFIRGKPLFAADKSHVHHKALQEFGSPLRALLAVLVFAVVQAALLVLWPGLPTLVACAVLWFVLSATLVQRSSWHPASVMAQRRLMRRLHVAHGYASATLQLAETRADVEQVLQHVIEAADACAVSIDGLELVSRRGETACRGPQGCDGSCQRHRLALPGRSCTWNAPFSREGAAIEEERETVMAGLLRQAAERLDALPGAPRRDRAVERRAAGAARPPEARGTGPRPATSGSVPGST